jgi:Tol biopolymer transport system component
MVRSTNQVFAVAITLGVALALVPAPAAGAADLVLASSRPDGVKANALSFQTSRSLSADGSRIAFQSLASNLLPADTDTASDVYVKHLSTGALLLASTNAAGVKGNDGSFTAALDADGTTVALDSVATNFDPSDADGLLDVYVKDLRTGNLTLVSRNAAGVKGNDHSSDPSLSADGTKVAFESRADNLDPADTDHDADIYVKDLATGSLTLASRSTSGGKGNGFSTMASLAVDGSSVAFQSRSTNLDPGDTDTLADIYARDLASGRTQLVSTTAPGAKANDDSFSPSMSADGNRVAFQTSSTNLDPADTDPNVADVYVKDRASGALRLASTTATGVKALSAPFFGSAAPSLSADGTQLAFESRATNLDPADTDGFYDIYAKDLATDALRLLSTTAQNVKSNNDDGLAAISPDASAVAFVSAATNLSPADTDALPDVYVKARGTSCADFSGSAPGAAPNPRRLPGLTVRITSPPTPTTRVVEERSLRGLDLGRRTRAKLALPSRRVTVTLARFAQPVVVTAYNTDGSVAGIATMTAPQATPQQLTFHGADIQRLRLSAPQQEALLLRLCAQPICTITGTGGPDVLTGTRRADVICARGGRDVVRGRGGADRLYAGSGDDVVRGGGGRDHAFGGNGGDRVRGGTGRDRLRAGRGDDRLDGGPAADRCAGGPGSDVASACEIVTGVP